MTVSVADTDITLYVISGDRLEALVSAGISGGIYLAAASTFIGVCSTAVTALLSSTFPPGAELEHAGFLMASIFSMALILLFAGLCAKASTGALGKYKQIKKAEAKLVSAARQ